MAREWEIRGLFGNEYALETAVEELKKHEGVQCQILDRRNLSVRLKGRDDSLEGIIKRAIEIAHGYVESEAPLGEFERTKQRLKEKKLKEFEEKKRRAAKH